MIDGSDHLGNPSAKLLSKSRVHLYRNAVEDVTWASVHSGIDYDYYLLCYHIVHYSNRTYTCSYGSRFVDIACKFRYSRRDIVTRNLILNTGVCPDR